MSRHEQDIVADEADIYRLLTDLLQRDACSSSAVSVQLDGVSDWEAVIDVAACHGVVPALQRALARLPAGEVPAEAKHEVASWMRAWRLRSLMMCAQLVDVCSLLEAHEVPVLAFKGPALALATTGSAAGRQYVDLDVLVMPRDFPHARAVLLDHGYVQVDQCLAISNGEQHVSRKHISLQSPGQPGTVELHWRFGSPPWDAYRVDEVWCRARRIDVGGRTVLTLSPADALWHACTHAVGHGWHKLGYLEDVALCMEALPVVGWPVVSERARRAGVWRLVSHAVLMAAHMLRLQIAEPARSEITAHPIARRLSREGKAAIYAGGVGRLPLFDEYRYRWAVFDTLWDAASVALRDLTAIAHPTVNDVALVPLPRKLRSLYWLIRPIRLMVQLGTLSPWQRRSGERREEPKRDKVAD